MILFRKDLKFIIEKSGHLELRLSAKQKQKKYCKQISLLDEKCTTKKMEEKLIDSCNITFVPKMLYNSAYNRI